MFARIIEFIPKTENKDEFVKVVRNEVLPILKKQPGFLDILPLFPETRAEKMIAVTLWTEKKSVERYELEVYPRVEAILKPYLATAVTFKHYTVDPTLCGHFAEALTA
jgi:heme-degrading monooxygenase HmoA